MNKELRKKIKEAAIKTQKRHGRTFLVNKVFEEMGEFMEAHYKLRTRSDKQVERLLHAQNEFCDLTLRCLMLYTYDNKDNMDDYIENKVNKILKEYD
jgi:hypothetical protein